MLQSLEFQRTGHELVAEQEQESPLQLGWSMLLSFPFILSTSRKLCVVSPFP